MTHGASPNPPRPESAGPHPLPHPLPLPNPHPPDEALVEAMNRGGDAAARAFEVLYRRHKDFVLRVALRFARDDDDALDVVQETFIYFLGKFPGFTLSARLTTFLYPAVRHIALARKRRRLPQPVEGDALERSCVPATPPDRADLADLARVLEGLSEVHREAIVLRFIDGMSLQEMAAALDVPEGTIKSRLHNAIAALRADPRTAAYFNQDR